jgi:hypothetical protein
MLPAPPALPLNAFRATILHGLESHKPMKIRAFAFVFAAAGGVFAPFAAAQELRHPANYQPARYSYDYYADEADPSASDAPSVASEPSAMAGSAAGVACSSCDPCNACSSCCDPCGSCCEDSCCDGCEDCDCGCGDDMWRLFGDNTILGFGLTGWVNAGMTANNWNNPSRFNGPVSFNDREDVYLNQLYAVLENPLDVEDGDWDFAARVDFLFGTDARFTKAVGLELDQFGGEHWNRGRDFHQIALPQFYAQFGNDRFNVLAGHFYTPVGYEVVTAPGNFFYSHAYTHQYGEPFTHTGALASYQLNDQWRAVGGVHFGWDTFDSAIDRAGFVGGLFWTPADDVTISATMTTGDEINAVGTLSNRTMYSLYGIFQLTEKWAYVLQHDNGWQDDAIGPGQQANWYGINQYLYYTINDQWRAGLRAEWFDDPNGYRVVSVGATNPAKGPFRGDFYEITAGLNWTPHSNWIIRPELRWDWYDGGAVGPKPFNDGNNSSQFLAAMDLIFQW